MNKTRWLLLITRAMGRYMPPEIFWTRSTGDFEARRWLWFLSGLTHPCGVKNYVAAHALRRS